MKQPIMAAEITANIAIVKTLLTFTVIFAHKSHANSNAARFYRCPHICICSGLETQCSDANLTRIPSPLPNTLQSLDLSGNAITYIASELNELNGLEFANFAGNQIAVMSSMAFREKSNLRELNFSGNQLTLEAVKEAFTTGSHSTPMPSLLVLNLAENQLGPSIKGGVFTGFHNLQSLDLSANNISFIQPMALNGLLRLTDLHLRQNELTLVPSAALQSLTALQYLDLSHNPITEITKDSFPPLSELKTIILNSMTGLGFIGAYSFSNLAALHIVQMSGCPHLKTINETAFVGVNNLTHIYLESNALNRLDNNLFPLGSLPNKSVHIYNNPLNCDCHLEWITNRQIHPIFAQPDLIFCQSPNALRGSKVMQITKQDFVCNASQDKTKTNTETVHKETDVVGIFGIVVPTGIGLMMLILVMTVHCQKQRPRLSSYELQLWMLTRSMSYGSLREQQSVASDTTSIRTVPTVVSY